MTKNILLGLGATAALVGASFAIVSCANDSTPVESEKTEATITYNKDAFLESTKDIELADYATEIVKDENKAKLDAIFTSDPINSLVVKSVTSAKNEQVRFTLNAKDGFILDKTEFVIDYGSGTEVDKLEYMTQADYITAMKDTKNKDKLFAIFNSTPKGAIGKIEVEGSGENVIFTLTPPAEGFTLNQNVFVIDYDNGAEVNETYAKTDATTDATITYNVYKFEVSKIISEVVE